MIQPTKLVRQNVLLCLLVVPACTLISSPGLRCSEDGFCEVSIEELVENAARYHGEKVWVRGGLRAAENLQTLNTLNRVLERHIWIEMTPVDLPRYQAFHLRIVKIKGTFNAKPNLSRACCAGALEKVREVRLSPNPD